LCVAWFLLHRGIWLLLCVARLFSLRGVVSSSLWPVASSPSCAAFGIFFFVWLGFFFFVLAWLLLHRVALLLFLRGLASSSWLGQFFFLVWLLLHRGLAYIFLLIVALLLHLGLASFFFVLAWFFLHRCMASPSWLDYFLFVFVVVSSFLLHHSLASSLHCGTASPSWLGYSFLVAWFFLHSGIWLLL
jgi:hypothetical protein